jgi:hypothetical protein
VFFNETRLFNWEEEMLEIRSEDIRRFFDLLGSIFCGLLIGFSLWDGTIQNSISNRWYYLPVFIGLVLITYLGIHRLVWNKVSSKFLYGYFNFILISILSFTLVSLFGIICSYLAGIFPAIFRFHFRPIMSWPTTVLIYLGATLPMAFFWLIGSITSWKFAKGNFQLK